MTAGEALRNSCYQSRGFREYSVMLFPEDPLGNRFLNWITRRMYPNWRTDTFDYFRLDDVDDNQLLTAACTISQVKSITNGKNAFFKPSSIILDMGSGIGRAVSNMHKKYSNQGTRVIGLDGDYPLIQPVSPGNFVAGRWEHLPFLDNTFTGVLGCESFPRYGYRTEGDNEVIKEVTRVCVEGAIWRATLAPDFSRLIKALGGLSLVDDKTNDVLVSQLAVNGWEVFRGSRVFIARLINKR